MEIDRLMIDAGASIYYDPDFRNVLEAHLTYLRQHTTTRTVDVEPQKAYKFEGDFFGLLASLGIQPHLQWLTMRMNGYTSTIEAHRNITTMMVPDSDTVGHIRQSHMTTRKII